jgi:hypothetical protein
MSEKPLLKIEAEELGLANRATKPLPLLLIGGGVALLALELLQISLISLVWPLFVILPGLLLLEPARRLTGGKRGWATFLALPGAILLTVGGLLALMNLTGHFESWAYAWLLLPAGMVGGLMFALRHERNHDIHRSGPRVVSLLTRIALVAGLVFELFVFETLGSWWPIALVVLGAYILLKDRRRVAVGAA